MRVMLLSSFLSLLACLLPLDGEESRPFTGENPLLLGDFRPDSPSLGASGTSISFPLSLVEALCSSR